MGAGMKIVLILLLSVFSQVTFAAARGVPRCWKSDLPDQDIQDGLFRVLVTTNQTDALEIASVLAVLSQSLTAQAGVAASDNLDRIEIDVKNDLRYWEPSAVFPTLDSFKVAVLNGIAAVLRLPGVTVECALVGRHFPVP